MKDIVKSLMLKVLKVQVYYILKFILIILTLTAIINIIGTPILHGTVASLGLACIIYNCKGLLSGLYHVGETIKGIIMLKGGDK